MAVKLCYIGGVTDGGNDELVASLRETQHETAVVPANRSFGGAVEEYADACQGFVVGGVLYDPREYVVLRPGNEAGQTEEQRYKEGRAFFHLVWIPDKGIRPKIMDVNVIVMLVERDGFLGIFTRAAPFPPLRWPDPGA